MTNIGTWDTVGPEICNQNTKAYEPPRIVKGSAVHKDIFFAIYSAMSTTTTTLKQGIGRERY